MNDNDIQNLLKKIDSITSVMEIVTSTIANSALTTLVTDQYGTAVLHIDGGRQNQLVITITNQTKDVINVQQFSGPVSSSNCNVTISFPNDTFYFYTPPSVDASTPGSWQLSTDSDSGWIGNIYLANMAPCTLQPKGKPGDSLKLTVDYGGAVPDDSRVMNVPVQVEYQNMQTTTGVPIQGSTPVQTLELMADEGKPSPLVGSFVGPAAVLNDGITKQSLTLRLVNTSQEPIQFIVPATGPTQSYIEVTLPVSDAAADAVWALCDTGTWAGFKNNASIAGSASKGWSVAASAATAGLFALTPDYTQVQNIPPGGTLELVLNGVTSGLEPGVVQVQVSLRRFALYGTQTFGVALEKSPLIYNSGLGSGMTLSAGSLGSNQALAVSGDSSSELIHITQSGAGAALLIDGGAVTINNALTANGFQSNAGAVISSNHVITSPPDPKTYPLLVTNAGDGSGLAIGWNRSGHTGETNFYNYGQKGNGGFYFYNNANCANTYPTDPNLLLSIDIGGNTTVQGSLTVNTTLAVSQNAAIAQNLDVTENVVIGGTAHMGATNTGALTVAGSISTGGGDFSFVDGGQPDQTAVRAFSAGGNMYLQSGTGDRTVFRNKAARDIMCVQDNGYISVGADVVDGWNTQAPLIVGAGPTLASYPVQDQFAYYGYQWNSDSSNEVLIGLDDRTGSSVLLPNVSIYAMGAIYAAVFWAFSDERIKTNRRDLVPEQSLYLINQLNVAEYRHKDMIANGTGVKKGFIAQEVEKIFPAAVAHSENFVPDIFSHPRRVEQSEGRIIIEMKEPVQLQEKDLVRFVTREGVTLEREVKPLNETTFTVENADGALQDFFVYGKKVKDFRTVDYQQIFSAGISAIQELSKRSDSLRGQYEQQQKENDALRARIISFEKRLEKMESACEKLTEL